MSNVSLAIGGRTFTVACAEGEEAHITELGQMIDAKLQTMGAAIGNNDTRMLLFAALLLADDLHEAQRKTAPSPTAPIPTPTDDRLAQRLETMATGLENCLQRLEVLARDA